MGTIEQGNGSVAVGNVMSLYKTARTIRRFEETVEELTNTNDIPGTVHLYIGEEAVASGVCAALAPTDYITSTHRGHGHLIAKGAALGPMLAEIMGRATGLNRGRGGSMHVADLSLGVLGANGIVAGGVPFALGAVWGAAQMGDERVAVAFFGDGGLGQGLLHECMNVAALWKLPVVFVCEDNGYAVSLPVKSSAAGWPVERARSYGMQGEEIDGMDAEVVFQKARLAVRRARCGDGPSYLHMKTYRFRGHHVGEAILKLSYRTEEEIRKWEMRDPVEILGHRLDGGIRAEIDRQVEEELKEAVAYALDSALPDPESACDYAYASRLVTRGKC